MCHIDLQETRECVVLPLQILMTALTVFFSESVHSSERTGTLLVSEEPDDAEAG